MKSRSVSGAEGFQDAVDDYIAENIRLIVEENKDKVVKALLGLGFQITYPLQEED